MVDAPSWEAIDEAVRRVFWTAVPERFYRVTLEV
jgi:hypothetical protein